MAENLILCTSQFTTVGAIKGTSKRKEGDLDFSTGIECHGVEFGMQVPTDPSRMVVTGRRSYKPFAFFKLIDETSPKWFQACSTGDTGKTVSFVMNKIDTGGKPQKFYQWDFTNVILTNMQHFQGNIIGTGGQQFQLHDYERIEFVFESITQTNVVAKTVFTDSLLGNK
ncbi:MAG TPA: type VI secretion system tube protein Hcp [Polyangiaceae bacterium]|jgi:type VI secretion system Hcp family effector